MKNKRKAKDLLLKIAIYFCAALVLCALVGIIGYILVEGIPHLSWDMFTTEYKPGIGLYGIKTMIVSTLLLVVTTLVIVTPIGICAAIYLNEYAKKGRMLNIGRFATESLAGIPSILYGLFGYAMFVVFFGLKYSILSGALTLAVMCLPVVVRNTEEALSSVPDSYREGSLALGAGKLRTIVKVVLPNAMNGILTSVILSIGRIVGETAAIIYTMGSSVSMPDGIMSAGRSLSVHLYFLAKEGISFDSAFAVAVVLVVVVAIINQLATLAAKLFSNKAKGGKA